MTDVKTANMYNNRGNLRSIIDPMSHVAQIDYTDAGQLRELTLFANDLPPITVPPFIPEVRGLPV